MSAKKIPEWFPKAEDLLKLTWNAVEIYEGEFFSEVVGVCFDADDEPFIVFEDGARLLRFDRSTKRWIFSGNSLNDKGIAVSVWRDDEKLPLLEELTQEEVEEEEKSRGAMLARAQIIREQWPLLRQLGIPEDSELAAVELPDLGDEVVVRFGGQAGTHRVEPRVEKALVSKVVVISGQPDWHDYDPTDKYFSCWLHDEDEWKLGYFKKSSPAGHGWHMISTKDNGVFPAEVQIIRSKG